MQSSFGAREAGVYAHIPFCIKKCDYCDFFSAPANPGDVESYAAVISREARLRYAEIDCANTVYLGGGTPSLLPIAALETVVSAIWREFAPRSEYEFTIEANPATFGLDKARAWRSLGVNRVSVGVQSHDDAMLRSLGRAHSFADTLAAFAALEKAGFTNLSADLMYGLPGQTRKMWKQTLKAALSLPISHISAYALSVEEGTPMHSAVGTGCVVIPDEEEARAMTDITAETLSAAGFFRYEISNYALPNFEARHNLIYWRGGSYVGLGAAAHGYAGGVRYANCRSLPKYISAVEEGRLPEAERNLVSRDDLREETIMLWLRLAEGLPFSVYAQRTSGDFLADYKKPAERLRSLGLIDWDDRAVYVTREGFHIHNAVLTALL